MISVITPNLNRAHTIGETLASLKSQTSDNWECIVVDDGSTDASARVVSEFAATDQRIRWHQRSRTPAGACACRNIGVELAKGARVMFLDSDDIAAPFCIEQRSEAAREAETADIVVFPTRMFKSEPGDEDFVWNVMTPESVLERFLRLDSPWQGTGPLWRKEAFVRLGSWRESLACWQDVDLSIRALNAGLTHVIRYDLPADVFIRRGDGRSISSSALRSTAKLRSKSEVLDGAVAAAKSIGPNPEDLRRRVRSVQSLAVDVINDHVLGRHGFGALGVWTRMVMAGIFPVTDAAIVFANGALLAPGVHRLPFARSISAWISRRYAHPEMIGRRTALKC